MQAEHGTGPCTKGGQNHKQPRATPERMGDRRGQTAGLGWAAGWVLDPGRPGIPPSGLWPCPRGADWGVTGRLPRGLCRRGSASDLHCRRVTAATVQRRDMAGCVGGLCSGHCRWPPRPPPGPAPLAARPSYSDSRPQTAQSYPLFRELLSAPKEPPFLGWEPRVGPG